MEEKVKIFRFLDEFHAENCVSYANIKKNLFDSNDVITISDLPFLPASLFKKMELFSVSRNNIFKTLFSSGTSGQSRSKIFLDKENAVNQINSLVQIISEKIGKKRVPMLVLDSLTQTANRTSFSARGAGILGFSIVGSKKFYALDGEMEIQSSEIKNFLKTEQKTKKFIYGFTSIIWEEILEKLENNAKILKDQKCILVHGGGWKKLSDLNISAEEFNSSVRRKLGPNIEIFEYYGMVEQTGSIFMGCEEGYLHTNQFNDIIIRDPDNLSLIENGEIGVIQSLTTLATSYPGFSILTEDLGVIYGNSEDQTKCACGREGKFFKVLGRLPKSEIRGCSNTYGI
tara:strand:+ start:3882 stop:4910 length:1029 start_codon:yes stop_codon:yes gene_type:complete